MNRLTLTRRAALTSLALMPLLAACGKKDEPAPAAAPDDQLSLSAMAESETADIIRRTQVDSLSPLEALNLLYELKKRLG